jgi:hypothetical protein
MPVVRLKMPAMFSCDQSPLESCFPVKNPMPRWTADTSLQPPFISASSAHDVFTTLDAVVWYSFVTQDMYDSPHPPSSRCFDSKNWLDNAKRLLVSGCATTRQPRRNYFNIIHTHTNKEISNQMTHLSRGQQALHAKPSAVCKANSPLAVKPACSPHNAKY